MSTEKEGFGKRLDRFMNQNGLKVPKLAEVSGISASALYKYLNAPDKVPNISILRKLAAAYPRLNLVWLAAHEGPMYLEEEPNPPEPEDPTHFMQMHQLMSKAESLRTLLDGDVGVPGKAALLPQALDLTQQLSEVAATLLHQTLDLEEGLEQLVNRQPPTL